MKNKKRINTDDLLVLITNIIGYMPFIVSFIFLILKLTNVITWSWIWVLSPLWIFLGLFLIIMFGFYIYIIIIAYSKPKNQKEQNERRAIGILWGTIICPLFPLFLYCAEENKKIRKEYMKNRGNLFEEDSDNNED